MRPDLRSAYETLFKPLGVSLVQFKVSFSLSRYQSNYTNNKLVEVIANDLFIMVTFLIISETPELYQGGGDGGP